MYRTDTDVWRGLSKNAFEGLAAPKTILPITVVLLGGQVLPFVLLAMANLLSPTARTISACATALVLLPRLLSISRFSQSFRSALLHPVGILALLAIQWHALARQVLGKPAEWKGRMYAAPKWKSV